MIIKASGRSALITATGLVVLCVSPVQAETGAKALVADSSSAGAAAAPLTIHRYLRHGWHHRRNYAHRKSQAVAAKAEPEKSEPPAAATSAATENSKAWPDIPLSVANANAQMLLAGVQLSAAAAIPSGRDAQAAPDSSTSAKGDGGTLVVAAADQLSDVDRSLREGAQGETAATNPPAAPAATMTMTSQASVWDQTSLIGKVFIGFGALLTMASAARLFMA
jgi:hypothetical protein